MTRYKEIDEYVFDITTDTGEMSASSISDDINILKKELKENHGYGEDRIKKIKFRVKRKALIRIR